MPSIFQFLPAASEGVVAGLQNFQNTLQAVDALDQRYRDVKERRNLDEAWKAGTGSTPVKPGVALPLEAPNLEMLDTYQAPVQNVGVQPPMVPAKPTTDQMKQVTTNVDTVNVPNFTATNVASGGVKQPTPRIGATSRLGDYVYDIKSKFEDYRAKNLAVGDIDKQINALISERARMKYDFLTPLTAEQKAAQDKAIPQIDAMIAELQAKKSEVQNAGLKGANNAKTITGATGTTGVGTPTGGTPPGKVGLPSQVDESQFNLVFDRLINVESGALQYDKNGNLTESSKGALGITQVMPATAKKPGFGVAPLKNQSKEEYIRFGREYLTALLTKYNGDFQKALAAYNAGPGTIDKAIAKGGDKWLTLAPKESQNYVNKFAGLSGNTVPTQVAENAVNAQPKLELVTTANAGENVGLTPGRPNTLNTAVNMSPRDFDILNTYILNERQTTVDLYNRKRQALINRANAAGNAGNVQRAYELLEQVDQLDSGINGALRSIDNNLWRAQGDKASQEFTFTGNPARMQAVWSHYLGSQIQIQPRSDGMYNLYINGQPAVDDKGQFIVRDRNSLSQEFYRTISEEYRKQDQAFRADRAKFTYEKGIEAQANLSVKQLEVLGNINKAIIDGNYKLAEKQLEMSGFGSPALTADGVAYVNKNGDVIVFRNNPPKLANGMTGEQVQYFPAPGAGLRKQ